MPRPVEETLPFRWDLIAPDQLGTLLAGVAPSDLWFLDDLVECAGRVVTRSGGADLIFVGRSLDSMFDLPGGALADIDDQRQVRRLPLSFQRSPVGSGRRWRRRPLTAGERAQARRALAAVGVTPHALARRTRPVAFFRPRPWTTSRSIRTCGRTSATFRSADAVVSARRMAGPGRGATA